MKWQSIVCGTILAILALAGTASAAPIVGTFNFANSVTVTGVDGPDVDLIRNQYTMDFFPAGGGNGQVNTTNPATGYFAPLFPGSSLINNLDVTDAGVAGFTNIVAGAAVSVPGFLNTFAAIPGLSFELTTLFTGGAPLCTGAEALNQSCSPTAASPFVLTPRTTGLDVSFGVQGIFRNGADIGLGLGSYTTQLVGGTVGGTLATLLAGGSISTSFSANYASRDIVPEPATLLTFGIGLGVLALHRRRRQGTQKA
jgi:hypothetical protein